MLREQLPPEPAPVVLIVEDDVLLRLTIAGSLRDAGFEVLEAANAAEAVQILECLPAEALFSDMNIPRRRAGAGRAWQRASQGRRSAAPQGPRGAAKSNICGEAFFPRKRRRKPALSRRQFG